MKNSKTKKKRILNAGQIKAILERFAREMRRRYGNLEIGVAYSDPLWDWPRFWRYFAR